MTARQNIERMRELEAAMNPFGREVTAAQKLWAFVTESNRIEGILRKPTNDEIAAHTAFVALPSVSVDDLCGFVRTVASVELRDKPGMDVFVGNHFPPRGGPSMRGHVEDLLGAVNGDRITPYAAHVRYESLHPFMDGNGRSGRVLWLWQMWQMHDADTLTLSFLHRFYYQALDASNR